MLHELTNEEISVNSFETLNGSQISNNYIDESSQISNTDNEKPNEKIVIINDIINENDNNNECKRRENVNNYIEDDIKERKTLSTSLLEPLPKMKSVNFDKKDEEVLINAVIYSENNKQVEEDSSCFEKPIFSEENTQNSTGTNTEKLIERYTPMESSEGPQNSECEYAAVSLKHTKKDDSMELDEQQIMNQNEATRRNIDRQIPQSVPVEEEPRKEFLLASSAKEK